MKYVISPAKTMKEFTYAYGDIVQMPRYPQATLALYEYMRGLDLEAICNFCRISDKLGRKSMREYEEWAWDTMGNPAIFTYHGIQYQALKPITFHAQELAYANDHVRILSGLYGSLCPLDCVHPYRLEMQAPLTLGHFHNLYEYWKDRLESDLRDDCLVDLASQEYSKVISEAIKNSDQYVRIEFYVMKNGVPKAISTAIKAARGAMLHEIIRMQPKQKEDLRQIKVDGFCFCSARSDEKRYVYIKE